MPEWTKIPNAPFVIGADAKFKPKAKGEPKTNDIWIAARTGDIKAIKKHLAKGVDVNDKDSIFGMTPLSWAALLGQTEAVKLLIQKGTDVNKRNNGGGTPLHGAAFLGRTETVNLLIQIGADVNAKNNDGDTPLDASAADWETTEFIAGMLQIKLDQEKVLTGRTKIAGILRQHSEKPKPNSK